MRVRPITYKEFLKLNHWATVYVQTPAKKKMVEMKFIFRAYTSFLYRRSRSVARLIKPGATRDIHRSWKDIFVLDTTPERSEIHELLSYDS